MLSEERRLDLRSTPPGKTPEKQSTTHIGKLKRVIFLLAEVDQSDGARMEAKVWREDSKAVGVILEVPWLKA